MTVSSEDIAPSYEPERVGDEGYDGGMENVEEGEQGREESSHDEPQTATVDHDELWRAIIDVETSWWKIEKTKERAIRTRTGLTVSQYYIVLSQLLDNPEFWKMDPVLVDRLRRLRDGRLEERGKRES